MKRFIVALTLVCMGAFVSASFAGDYHAGTNLVCSDCHVMHASKTHNYGDGRGEIAAPLTAHEYLLYGDVNETCLNCHDNSANGPDVYGENTGMYTGVTRLGGGLNGSVNGYGAEGGSYTQYTGHTLGSTAVAPGGTYAATGDGLECTSCHAQHGSATQYRNLLNRGIFPAKNVTYEVTTTPTNTKDVMERSATLNDAAHYAYTNVDFEEPARDSSRYGNWCKTCHTNFHGSGGDAATVGGVTGGYKVDSTKPWLRHPTADVNLGAGASATFVSNLSAFNAKLNKLKMMDSQGLWTGAAADTTLTPSCFSCHKAHGNGNPFGLIYMKGAAAGGITDEGDGGTDHDMCKQCHSQG